MKKKAISFDTVREIGLALPDVEEGTIYGSPALKVRGKMFACLAVHRSADPGSLAIRMRTRARNSGEGSTASAAASARSMSPSVIGSPNR